MAFNALVPLERHHDRSAFDCGSLALNDYLKKYALQNQLKNAGRTYVATKNTTTQVIAYYTLIAGDVHRAQVPGSISHGLGRHPITVVVLARLAVDHSYQGKGLGSGLLKDALLRVLEASDIIGVRALLVRAKDERASDFYQRFGFLLSPTDPLHLYLSLADITASLK